MSGTRDTKSAMVTKDIKAQRGRRVSARPSRSTFAISITCVHFAAVLCIAVPARAELAFFANGRSMSVKSHRVEGNALVLTMRSGGEMTVDPSIVERFAPDEVPWPEPVVEKPAPPSAPSVAVPYGDLIDRFSREQGVDAKIVRAVIQVESAYQQSARSRKGAMGLMQLMPETARQYAVSDPYDPESNIEAGIKHLKSLMERLPRLELALAAYNAGEAAVQKFRGIPPFPETRDYVARILKLVGR
jgi:Transglycosylase SLT domain